MRVGDRVAEGHPIFLVRAVDYQLRLAEAERPDLILMDIQLPVLDGHEATRRIRQNAELAAIPIIVVTSYALARLDALHTALTQLVLEGSDLARITAEVADVLAVGVAALVWAGYSGAKAVRLSHSLVWDEPPSRTRPLTGLTALHPTPRLRRRLRP